MLALFSKKFDQSAMIFKIEPIINKKIEPIINKKNEPIINEKTEPIIIINEKMYCKMIFWYLKIKVPFMGSMRLLFFKL